MEEKDDNCLWVYEIIYSNKVNRPRYLQLYFFCMHFLLSIELWFIHQLMGLVLALHGLKKHVFEDLLMPLHHFTSVYWCYSIWLYLNVWYHSIICSCLVLDVASLSYLYLISFCCLLVAWSPNLKLMYYFVNDTSKDP